VLVLFECGELTGAALLAGVRRVAVVVMAETTPSVGLPDARLMQSILSKELSVGPSTIERLQLNGRYSMKYTLRFDTEQVGELAARYTVKQTPRERETEAQIEEVIALSVRKKAFYTRTEFLTVCEWKTPRSRSRCASNDQRFIIEATSLALKAESERLRVEILTLLCGVSWPTASVLLHFGHSERYPILDFRALWSLSIEEPKSDYAFPFWWDYVEICRDLALQCGVSMRVLDRALWQYSADNPQ
jgi:hypothetical protein